MLGAGISKIETLSNNSSQMMSQGFAHMRSRINVVVSVLAAIPDGTKVYVPEHLVSSLPGDGSIEGMVSRIYYISQEIQAPSMSTHLSREYAAERFKALIGSYVIICEEGMEEASLKRQLHEIENPDGPVRTQKSKPIFHLFNYLPSEIRRKIWQYALGSEEIVRVAPLFSQDDNYYCFGDLMVQSVSKKAWIHLVCKEAHEEATANPFLKTIESGPCIVNTATDIFWIQDCDDNFIEWIDYTWRDSGIERIAMKYEYWFDDPSQFKRVFRQLAGGRYREIILLFDEDIYHLVPGTVTFDLEPKGSPSDYDLSGETWDETSALLKEDLRDYVKNIGERRERLLKEGKSEADLDRRGPKDVSGWVIPDVKFRRCTKHVAELEN